MTVFREFKVISICPNTWKKMQISEIINFLETVAPLSLQESYDNAGLLTGSPQWTCTGVLTCLDVTEAVVQEAMDRQCNLVIAHHPLIFRGLKRLNGSDPVGRTLIKAIKGDIAVYAIHTNLDNVLDGVNGSFADRLGLVGRTVLVPLPGQLRKLFCFVPDAHLEKVRQALFAAGAGTIGKYRGCSFTAAGTGSFTAGEGADPFVGKIGEAHFESEQRLEVIYPVFREKAVLTAMLQAHPYEEVAYDIVRLENPHPTVGAGLVGMLPDPLSETAFLDAVKQLFGIPVIRHSRFTGRPVRKVAICGGAGSFLISNALSAGADAFLTADLKYHEFFEPDGRLLLADIGHFESEQYAIGLVYGLLKEKFPTFAVLKTEIATNPVNYH
jgi:dinuclear metal center YbgI/SA1388 family protein